MPLTAPPELRMLQRSIADLSRAGSAQQVSVLQRVSAHLRMQIRAQLSSGTRPDGGQQAPTARGKPGLVSNKIAQTVRVSPMPGGVQGSSVIPWLETHQEGFAFAARSAGGQLLILRKGRFVGAARAARGWAGPKSWRDVHASAHRVGPRLLPQRPIYPVGGVMPSPWASAINTGALEGMERWYDRVR